MSSLSFDVAVNADFELRGSYYFIKLWSDEIIVVCLRVRPGFKYPVTLE
jgi:hypothetical protein